MDYFQALILSVIEGITEFLPISSTGHLILAADLLKIAQTEFVKSFEIFIQLGAILAVIVLYWKMILLNVKVVSKVFVAFLPTAFFGFFLYKIVKHYLLGNTSVVLISLFVGGIFLIILEGVFKEKNNLISRIEDIKTRDALFIGLFQSISIIPGVSRSAATISGGLFIGLERKTAVEFSFLLAIPTMMAASSLDLIKSNLSFTSQEFMVLIIGFMGSFIVALLAIRFFLKFIQKHTFIPFGIYRIVLSLIFWLMITK